MGELKEDWEMFQRNHLYGQRSVQTKVEHAIRDGKECCFACEENTGRKRVAKEEDEKTTSTQFTAL